VYYIVHSVRIGMHEYCRLYSAVYGIKIACASNTVYIVQYVVSRLHA
jgi:hypothetical protein